MFTTVNTFVSCQAPLLLLPTNMLCLPQHDCDDMHVYECLLTQLPYAAALGQVPGIGKLLSERLHGAGLGSLRQLAAADPRRIEAVTQRHFPFGGSCLASGLTSWHACHHI